MVCIRDLRFWNSRLAEGEQYRRQQPLFRGNVYARHIAFYDRLMRMAQNAADIEEMTGTYVCLKMAREVDLEIYSAWAGHLRN